MPSKKTKTGKKKVQPGVATTPDANGNAAQGHSKETSPEPPPSPTPTPAPAADRASKSKESSPQPEIVLELDPITRAEQLKEEGNVAFRVKQYGSAIDFYTQAIDLRPTEPTYLTNRAASYMALNRFRPALADCQQAATLQTSSPSLKTLLRLARCQLAVGSPNPASSTLRQVFSLDPTNPTAKQLQKKATDLGAHLLNFQQAKERKNWALARLALDKCMQSIEGEGGGAGAAPTEWRCWRVELELARCNWDAANAAANDAMRLDPNSADILALRGLVLFLMAKLPSALQHAVSALRLDPDNVPAKQLRLRVKAIERLKEEGNTKFKIARYQEAIDKYTEALKIIGEREEEGNGGQIRATLLSNRATSLLKLEDHEQALRDTDASLKLFPGSYKALRTRARIYLHMEKYEAAISDFKDATEQAQMDDSVADVKSLQTELRKAETALKRSKTKDYYKILGLAKDCADSEIKKAYRRESLKHHPDKGGDEERFKLVAEAYAVLSDPQRKERYDLGADEDGSASSSGMHDPFGSGMDSPFADIFAQFAGGGVRFSSGGGGGHHFSFAG